MNSASVSTQNNTINRTDSVVNGQFSSSSSRSPAAALDALSAKDEKKKYLTAYEKYLYDSQHDMHFKAEEKAGQRIRFYRILGDIGLGNFSRVKLGIHLLAKGNE